MKQAVQSVSRRAVSLLLCVALLFGMIVSVQLSASITANAGLNKESIKAPFSFQVPETIWMDFSSGGTNVITRWSNMDPNGNIPASPTDTEGKIYFTVPATVSGLTLTSDSGIDAGQPTQSGSTYIWTITDKSLSVNVSPGGTREVKWTLNCVVGGETLTFTHYSLAWAPTTVIHGAGASGAVDGTWQSTLLTLMGADAITKSSNVIAALDGDENDDPNPGKNGPYAANSNLVDDIVSGTFKRGGGNTCMTDVNVMTKSASGGIAFGAWNSDNEGEPKKAISGAEGTVRVDTSRFSNLQQVPGLKVNILFSDDRSTDNAFGERNSRVEFPEGTNLVSLGSGYGAPTMVVNESTPASGTKFSHNISGTQTETITLYSHLYSFWKNVFDRDDCTFDYRTDLKITKVDKTVLRNAVTAAVQYPQQWMDDPTEFNNALKAAASVLGHPRGSGDGAAQAQALNIAADENTPEAMNATPTFYAPETIYLNPSIASESTTVDWQYFAGDVYDPAAPQQFGSPSAAKNAATGTLYFYCQAATSVKISVQAITGGGNALNVKSAQRTLPNPAANTFDIADGTNAGSTFNANQVVLQLSDASTSYNKSALLRWTAEYTVNGTVFKSYAYSYIYKPYQGITAAAVAGCSEVDLQMMLWWLGLHGVDRPALHTTQWRWPNEKSDEKRNAVVSYSKEADALAGPYIMDPNANLTTLVQQGNNVPYTGVENNPPVSNNHPYRSQIDGAIRDLMSDTTTTGGAGITAGTGSIRFQAHRNSGNGTTSPMGHLYVDSSRYTNLQQVPNLDWLYLNTDDWGTNTNSNTKDTKYWFYNQIGSNAIYVPGGNANNVGSIYRNWDDQVDDRTGKAQGFWSSGYRFGNKSLNGIHRNSDSGAPGSGGAWGVADGGIRGSFSDIDMADFPVWSPTVLKSTVCLYVASESGGDWKSNWNGELTDTSAVSGKDNWVAGMPQTQISIKRVDKSELREKLQREITKGLQENQVSNWSDYLAAMDDLAEALCRPDYPLTGTESNALINDMTATEERPTQEPEVFFNVPELIYLTPSTATGSVALQYFANNIAPGRTDLQKVSSFGQPSSNKDDTYGVLWFHVPGAEYISLHLDPDFDLFPDMTSGNGAGDDTEIKLRYLERPENGAPKGFGSRGAGDQYTDFDDATTQSYAGAGADWVYGEINGAASKSYNESKLVRWKGTYKMPGDTQERVAYAYTYMYRPYDGIYGAGQRAKQEDAMNGSVTWFMGVHGVAKEPLHGFDDDGMERQRQIWDYDTASADSGSDGSGGADGFYLSTLSTPGGKITNPLTGLDYTSKYLSRTSRTGDGLGAFLYHYRYYNTGGRGSASQQFDSPHGKLYVDVSRYKSIYDVPNFQWNTIQARTNKSDATWLLEFPGINDNGLLNGGATYWDKVNVRYGHTVSNTSGTALENKQLPWRMGPNLMAGQTVPQKYDNVTNLVGGTYTVPGGKTGNWRDTAYLMNKLDTLGKWDGTNDNVQYYHYVYGFANNEGLSGVAGGIPWDYGMSLDGMVTNDAEMNDLRGTNPADRKFTRTRSRVVTDLRLQDKTLLREEVQQAIGKGLQESDMTAAQWTAYQKNLSAAALSLCRPDEDMGALESAKLIDSISTEYHFARNEHYNLAKNELAASEKLIYSLQDTVTGSAWCEAGTNSAEATVSAEEGYVYQYHTLTLGGTEGEQNAATSSSVVARGTDMLWKMYYYPQYYVKFHASGGTGEMQDQAMVWGTPENLNSNAFHKDGYVFRGWASTPEGAAALNPNYTDGQLVENLCDAPNGVVHLYAVWEEICYNARWIAGWRPTATNTMAPDDIDTDDEGLGDWEANKNPARDGFAGSGFNPPAQPDLIYNINFEGEPVRTGFTFKGWAKTESDALDGHVDYTTADINGKTMAQLAQLASSDDDGEWYDRSAESHPTDVRKYVLFWAVWQPNEYGVTFDANSGYFGTQDITEWGNTAKQFYDAAYPYTGQASKTLPDDSLKPEAGTSQYDITSANDYHYRVPEPTKAGYVLDGWALTANGTVAFEHPFEKTTKALADLHSLQAPSNLVQQLRFYAIWSAAKNYVSFDAGDGSFADPQPVNPGIVYTNAAFSTASNWKVPTAPAGKTFIGYANANAPGTVVISTDGSTTAAPEMFNTGASESNPTQYVAVYSANTYYVQYAFDGGTVSGYEGETETGSIGVTFGGQFKNFNFPAAPVKAGYDFTGWKSDDPNLTIGAEGNETVGSTLSGDEDDPTVFTAQYTPTNFYITYDFNNGSNTTVDSTVKAYSSTGAAQQYKDDGTNFALVSGDNVPKKAGHTFTGWKQRGGGETALAIAADGTTAVPVSGLSTESSAPTVFDAQFTPIRYTIIYNANEGAFEGAAISNSSEVTFGNAFSSGTNGSYAEPTRSGYTFGGWVLTAAGETVVIEQGGGDTLDADMLTTLGLNPHEADSVEVYALWLPKDTQYKVIVHLQTAQGGDNYSTEPFVSEGLSYYGTAKTGQTVKVTAAAITDYSHNADKDSPAGLEQAVIYNGDGAEKNYSEYHIYYDRSKVKLSYDLDGGSFGSDDPTPANNSMHVWGSAVTITSEPSKTGYTFTGWELKTGEATLSGDKNKSVTFAKTDVVLQAQWSANTYTLRYVLPSDYNGAATMPNPAQVTVGYSATATTNVAAPLTLAGYDWAGWVISGAANANELNGTAVGITSGAKLPNTLLTASGEVTLTASFSPQTYYIQYKNGAAETDSTVKFKKTYGEGTAGVPEAPTKAGHTFAGWTNTTHGTINSGADSVPAGLSTDDTDPTVFTAQFTPINYTINYNANQGAFADDETNNSSVVEFGKAFSTGAGEAYAEPTRTGYVFAGWVLTAAGETVVIAKGGGDELDADMLTTLGLNALTADEAEVFAIWAPSTATSYTLEINLQDAFDGYTIAKTYTLQGTTGAKPYESSAYALTAADTADHEHYSFNSGMSNQDVAIAADGSTVYKFYYDRSKVKLSYDLDGGSFGSDDPTPANNSMHVWGSAVTIMTEPSKTGYTFTGWELETAGTATLSGDKNKSVAFAKTDVVLQAQWFANSYTLNYVLPSDYNGAATMPDPAQVTVGYSATATTDVAAPLTLAGYDWAGWVISGATNANALNGTAVGITSGATLPNTLLTASGEVTLTASFSPQTYYIQYKNGAAETDSTVKFKKTYGEGTPGVPTAPTKAGHTFAGWKNEPHGTINSGADSVPAGLSTDDTDPTVFTAQFTPIRYTIRYNANQGTFADDETNNSSVVEFGKAFSTGTGNDYAEPTRTGYVFAGWVLTAAGETVVIAKGGGDTLDADMLTALDLEPHEADSAEVFAIWAPSTATSYKMEIYLQDAFGGYPEEAEKTYTLQGTTGAKPYESSAYALTAADTADHAYYDYNNTKSNHGTAIAADGSTVYKFYYDRKTYELRIVPNNGTAEYSGGTFRWGASTALPPGPGKDGSTFSAWAPSGTASITGNTVTIGQGTAYITAQYGALTYYLRLDYNDGEGETPSQKKDFDLTYEAGKTFGSLNGWEEEPQRTGYTFTGWKHGETTVTGTDALPYAQLSTTQGTYTTYVAQWSAKTDISYTVQYWLQNASGTYPALASGTKTFSDGTTNQNKTLAQEQIPTAPDGYVPVTEHSAATPITLGDTELIRGDGSTVFKYYFRRSAYSLTINNNGAQSGPESPAGQRLWGSTYTIPSNPQKEGYNFTGWSVNNGEAPGAAVSYNAGSGKYTVIVGKGNTVVTARFEAKTYQVSYDYQGGALSGGAGPAGSTVTFGKTYGEGTFWPNTELEAEPRLEKTGYVFSGWYTEADGKGSSIAKSSTVGALPEIAPFAVYYAYWTAGEVNYKVEVYLQKADGSYEDSPAATKNFAAATGDAVTADGSVYSDPYYVFDGNIASGTAAADSSTVLKVYFNRKQVKLHYDLNGGTGKTDPAQSFLWGSEYTIPAPNPTRSGYKFQGWADPPTAGEGAAINGNTVTLGKTDTTVQAVWSPNEFFLNFRSPKPLSPSEVGQAYDATQTIIEDELVKYDGSVPALTDPEPIPGYRFMGWYDKDGDLVQAGDTVDFETADGGIEAITAYFAAEYTIRYDANGGTISETGNPLTTDRAVWWGAKYKDGVAPVGDAFPAPNAREGYDFLGWFTQPQDGTQVTAELDIPMLRQPAYIPADGVAPKKAARAAGAAADQTLYAHWQAVTTPAPTPEDPELPGWVAPVLGVVLGLGGIGTGAAVAMQAVAASALGALLLTVGALLPQLVRWLKPDSGTDPEPKPGTDDPQPAEDPEQPKPGGEYVRPPKTGDILPSQLLALLPFSGMALFGMALGRRRRKEEDEA